MKGVVVSNFKQFYASGRHKCMVPSPIHRTQDLNTAGTYSFRYIHTASAGDMAS